MKVYSPTLETNIEKKPVPVTQDDIKPGWLRAPEIEYC